jgi:Domain of unknown function (DUF5134)
MACRARGRKDAEVTAPAWLAGGFAALMILIAACCASRLAIWRLRGRYTELDADGLHVLMGVAMAGMLEPRLSLIPVTFWRAAFAAAGAWFAWQAIRARSRRRPGSWRCAHPAPHAVECAAMIYMLLPAGSALAGHAPAATMAGMTGAVGAAAGNPALTLVLALFMLGYLLWTTDRLTTLSRARSATARGATMSRQSAATPAPAAGSAQGAPGPARTAHAGAAPGPALAPRFAACYKIAMSIAMGYMLILMI